MSGCVVKYDENLMVWYARPYLGTNPVTGRRMRPYKQFPSAKTESEAQAQADKWWATISPTGSNGVGLALPDMLELYIKDRALNGMAASTVDTYRSIVRSQVKPLLSKVDPRHVTAYNISQFTSMLLTSEEDGGRGLTRNTARKTLSFLKGAFRWLVKQGLTDINPIYEIEMPKREDIEARSLMPSEIRALMGSIDDIISSPADSIADRRLFAASIAALIALHCATRIGEVCALRFGSFNLFRHDVRIGDQASETKSAGFDRRRPKYDSAGTISIDDETIDAVNRDERQLVKQGVTVTPETFVVSVDGKMTRPSDLRKWYKRLLKRAGLSTDIVFHTLRHTHATLLIAKGVDIKTVSGRLRHKDVATTMRTYAHVMPGHDAAAAQAFAETAKEYRL